MEEKIIQITAGRGPLECQWVVAKVLKTFLQEATQAGISYTILSREEGDANLTVKSVTLQLKGKELASFLKSWLGTVCWVGKSTFRKFHQRSNWYIGVFELDQLQRQTFSERDVQFQTTRSQGNGGQNVNKVNSAVRATHLPTGISVLAQDSRSQLDNKKLALARLKEKLAEIELQQLAELDKIIDDHKNWGIIHSKIYGGSYSWNQFQKRYMPKEKYKCTPLKEIAVLKYHTSAMEIGEMLLECKPYVQ